MPNIIINIPLVYICTHPSEASCTFDVTITGSAIYGVKRRSHHIPNFPDLVKLCSLENWRLEIWSLEYCFTPLWPCWQRRKSFLVVNSSRQRGPWLRNLGKSLTNISVQTAKRNFFLEYTKLHVSLWRVMFMVFRIIWVLFVVGVIVL